MADKDISSLIKKKETTNEKIRTYALEMFKWEKNKSPTQKEFSHEYLKRLKKIFETEFKELENDKK